MNTTYLVVMAVYLIAMLAIGFFASKRIESMDDFFVAGRSLGLLVTLGTFAATFVSSSSIIGFVGWLYVSGWSGLWAIGGTVLSIVFGSIFLLGKIREFGQFTVPDLFAARYYSEKMRILPVIIILLLYIVFVTVEIMGAGKALEVLLNMDYTVSCISIAIIFVLYTMAGGMFAVAWTDTIQMFIGFGAVIASIFVALNKVGGFTAMNIQLAQIDPGLVAPITGTASTAVIFIIWNHLVWGVGNISQPSNLVRAYSAKNAKTARLGSAISGVIFVVFYFASMILGGTARILYPNLQDIDHAFPTLVQNLFNPVIGGILIAAILAIIMSTTDSVLLVIGSTIGNDIYRKYINKDANSNQILKISRISIVITGLLALIFALTKPAPVLYVQIFNYSTIGSAFFIPLMVGLYWKRANKQGAFASMLGGALTNIVWYYLGQPFGLHPVIPGVIVALILIYSVSLATEEPPESAIEMFFPTSKAL